MYPHELEMLQQLWFPVARSEDVVGGPARAELLGERLVVFRTGEGLAVATDRCAHRGARLSLGRLTDDVLECPYHGWRYSADGRCALVPSQPSAHPSARLTTWPAEERYGLVWACLGEPLLEVPAIPEIDRADGWEVACGEVFDVGCGLRSITENFRDSSHFAFVHRERFGDVSPEIPAYEVCRDGWTLAWDLPVTFGPRWEVWAAEDDGRPRYRFGETGGDGSGAPGGDGTRTQLLRYRFGAPSLSYVHSEHEGAGRLVCQVAAPLGIEGVRCRVFWFVAADAAFLQREGGLGTQVDIESRVFAEDVPIVESLDPLEAPLELDGQAHVRADRYSVAYRRLFGDLLRRFVVSRETGGPFDARPPSRSPFDFPSVPA